MKNLFHVFSTLFVCAFLISCEKPKEEIPVSSVSISQPTAEMVEGETVQLKATVLPADATDKTVEWSSSKQSVATITDKGLVTAIAEGTSTITASAGGKTATCQITVSKRVIEVTSVTLNKEMLELVEGEEETLVATVMPDNATDKTVEWSSSSPDIATVDGGKVSGIKEGEAIITAKAGEKTATCKVVVTKRFIAVESIELNKTKLELTEGDSDILVATVKPDDATDKTVTWVSSDESIVTVDDGGTVKAIKEGKASIAAKAGEKKAVCEVIVNKKVIAVESITLDKTTITMLEDESTVLTATVKPDNATDKTISWSSSDTNVATVNEGRVTSIKEGKTIITAKAGDKEATCEVTVNKRVIEVTSITLNYTDLSLIKGDEQVLVATVKPDNATYKTVTWSSSDGKIATVNNDGKVTAIKSGTATITAKAGEKTANCEVTVSTPVESITLDRTSITIEEGQGTTLIAIIVPDDADENTATWSSSDSKVATVDQSGNVKGIKEGTATITANAGGKSATCKVSVKKQVIPVTSITLNKTSLSLEKGKSEKLTATVKPDDATDKTVNWSSSDASVATVDSNGKITAVAGGQAVITAKAGEQSATCAVSVIVPVSSITLSETSLTLAKGESATLTATVNPEDATDNKVTWVSSDRNVATVDQNGKVTAKAGGKATITAACGGKTADCSITVNVPVTSIKLNKSSISLKKGETETLTATVSPSDATDKTVTWKSSDESVATVSDGKITAKKSGSATITAQAGDQKATCEFTVTNPVTSITLDKTSITLEEDQSTTLKATVKPDDADDKTVTWTSSNTSVATVDSNGKVTAVKAGSATITAKAGEKSATCSVTVQSKVIAVTSITLNKTSLSLEKGKSETLIATVKPDNATDKTVTWTSSNTSIATVDNNGKVTAQDVGTATITAKAGEKSATCSITVNAPQIEAVDLGLSVKWGSFNLGASAPEGYGDHYAWGEIKPKDDYSWESYKWCNGSEDSLTKYDTNSSYGTVDNKTVLDPEDDVAHVLLGGNWRMPTDAEWTELRTKCTWTKTTLNGVCGSLVAAPNGNSIFLPAAGSRYNAEHNDVGVVGVYWSSSLDTNRPYWAWSVYFYSNVVERGDNGLYRYGGQSVRPVYDVIIPVTSISLSKSSLNLNVGDSEDLTATISPDNATYQTITWKSSNLDIVAISDVEGKSISVTAKSAGTATVTAYSADGKKSATCSLSVTVPVESVTLDQTSITLEEGQSVTLTATVYPSDATDKTVVWSSSNTTVATVSNGIVTAIKEGSSIVSAQSGDKSANCTVTVQKKDVSLFITFIDSNVKDVCVSNWDSNGDGELSYEEAANVQTINSVFAGNKQVVSFNEFRFFTGVTELVDYAFSGCANLKSIVLPNTVKSIGYYSFNNCTSLHDLTLSESLMSIGKYAFAYCSGLEDVIIPNNVSVINSYSFRGCSKLKSVYLPYGITTIGIRAFQDCSSLSEIKLPNSVTIIEQYSFAYSGLLHIEIPNSVKQINRDAFLYCINLQEVVLPDGITIIDIGAFAACHKLSSINIPESVTRICDCAFSGCTSLANLPLPGGLTTIDGNAFEYCGLTSMVLPNSVTTIGNAIFLGCEALTNVSLPTNLKSIGHNMFNGCTNLTSVTIPNSVQSIGNQSFNNCRHLISISVPKNVVSIGNYAFNDCISLTSFIVQRETPPSLGTGGLNNTNNCPIKVPAQSVAAYKSADGWSDYANRIQAIPE